jgi:hypothetical protein
VAALRIGRASHTLRKAGVGPEIATPRLLVASVAAAAPAALAAILPGRAAIAVGHIDLALTRFAHVRAAISVRGAAITDDLALSAALAGKTASGATIERARAGDAITEARCEAGLGRHTRHWLATATLAFIGHRAGRTGGFAGSTRRTVGSRAGSARSGSARSRAANASGTPTQCDAQAAAARGIEHAAIEVQTERTTYARSGISRTERVTTAAATREQPDQ